MIVRRLADMLGTEREVKAQNWTSRRLLLGKDGMNFSLHDTVIHPGTSTRMCYRNHLEAVYVTAGRGSVELVDTGERFPLEAGTVYALNEHDEHVLHADDEEGLRMVCVFSPPVMGTEVHDETGAYPLVAAAGPGRTQEEEEG